MEIKRRLSNHWIQRYRVLFMRRPISSPKFTMLKKKGSKHKSISIKIAYLYFGLQIQAFKKAKVKFNILSVIR